jgi:hypothetical protein
VLFSVNSFGQKLIEKSISSRADQVILDFNVIDQIELFNAKADTEFSILAEGRTYFPDFNLKEVNGVIYLEENDQVSDEEVYSLDKVCSIEPNFTSYQVFIPEGKKLYISFIEGNFLADNFKGELNLIAEDGILKLDHMSNSVNIRLSSGSIYVRNIENTSIDAKTNLGSLITNTPLEELSESKKHLINTVGTGNKSLLIRTIMANIYLNVSKD